MNMYMIEYYDFYICPNNKTLSYTTTTKEGYRQYKSEAKECRECPLREKCTKKTKTCSEKVINQTIYGKNIKRRPMKKDIRKSGKKY